MLLEVMPLTQKLALEMWPRYAVPSGAAHPWLNKQLKLINGRADKVQYPGVGMRDGMA